VKNTDYVVYLTTKRGRSTKFSRDESGWSEVSPVGIERPCTAEQVLNHLLPALALGEGVIRTRVHLKRGRHFSPALELMRERAKSGTG